MIGALIGIVDFKKKDSLILLVNDVGYLIYPPSVFLQNCAIGSKQKLYIYTHVREDNFQLFGFSSPEELDLFELLLSVSGVGPKTALLVLNRGVSEIQKAVLQADVSFFTSIPRLGTKNAQKIIIELKSKLGSIKDLDLHGDTAQNEKIVEALTQFGFTRREISVALTQLSEPNLAFEQKLKRALQLLGTK